MPSARVRGPPPAASPAPSPERWEVRCERSPAGRARPPGAPPLLRQVPRHRHRGGREDAAGQGDRAGGARHHPHRLVPAVRAVRGPERRLLLPARRGRGGVDRVRGRRRVLPDLGGVFWRDGELPEQASPTTRGLVTKAPHQLLFDDDAEEVTLGDSNGGTIKLDGDGVTATRDSGTVAVGSSGVSINDDAFTVS